MIGRCTTIVLLFAQLAGCATLRPPARLPVANSLTLTQLVIYGDFELPQEHRVLTQLDQMRGQIATQLALTATQEPIHVYLFKTPKRYRTFLRTHFPGFPDRRAFFVQTDTRLSVYARWGDRIAEDLRHEVAHGYIHAVVPSIPLWIDEGLAEYFEVAAPDRGLNRAHLDQLLSEIQKNGWRPRLSRLEHLDTIHNMQQIDYAEAWAWTHFLLETTPDRRAVLQAYLRDLARGEGSAQLAARIRQLEPSAEANLMAHLEHLATPQITDEN